MAEWKVKVINGKEYWVRVSDSGNEIVFGDPMGDLAKAQANAISEVMANERRAMDEVRREQRENERYHVRDTEMNLPQWNPDIPRQNEEDDLLHELVSEEELNKIEHENLDKRIKEAEEQFKKDCINRAAILLEKNRELFMKRYAEYHNGAEAKYAAKIIENDIDAEIKNTFGDVKLDSAKTMEFLANIYQEKADELFVKINERDVANHRRKQNMKIVWIALAILGAGILLAFAPYIFR